MSGKEIPECVSIIHGYSLRSVRKNLSVWPMRAICVAPAVQIVYRCGLLNRSNVSMDARKRRLFGVRRQSGCYIAAKNFGKFLLHVLAIWISSHRGGVKKEEINLGQGKPIIIYTSYDKEREIDDYPLIAQFRQLNYLVITPEDLENVEPPLSVASIFNAAKEFLKAAWVVSGELNLVLASGTNQFAAASTRVRIFLEYLHPVISAKMLRGYLQLLPVVRTFTRMESRTIIYVRGGNSPVPVIGQIIREEREKTQILIKYIPHSVNTRPWYVGAAYFHSDIALVPEKYPRALLDPSIFKLLPACRHLPKARFQHLAKDADQSALRNEVFVAPSASPISKFDRTGVSVAIELCRICQREGVVPTARTKAGGGLFAGRRDSAKLHSAGGYHQSDRMPLETIARRARLFFVLPDFHGAYVSNILLDMVMASVPTAIIIPSNIDPNDSIENFCSEMEPLVVTIKSTRRIRELLENSDERAALVDAGQPLRDLLGSDNQYCSLLN